MTVIRADDSHRGPFPSLPAFRVVSPGQLAELNSMDKLESAIHFLWRNDHVESTVDLLPFVVNLLIAGLLATIVAIVYVRFGTSLNNRRAFSRNFVLVAMTTMFIITVVKSSIAISLGLVGALSIVRFRTAVKDPEELAFMFIAIAIGLGLGAGQRVLSIVATAMIVGMFIVKMRVRPVETQNLFMVISSQSPEENELQLVTETLKEHCSAVSLKRFDESKDHFEASFLVEFDGFDKLNDAKGSVRRINETAKVTILDNARIM